MGKLSPEEIEKNRQSTKKLAKICLIIFCIAAIIVVGASVMKSLGKKTKDPDVFYEVVSSNEYARDGKKCRAYRVYVKEKPSESDAKAIFEKVTDDKYYLHIVWFYLSREDAKGTDGYDWVMEQTSQGSIPSLK